ncbi:ABC transporter ATP-binding protein [Labrys neptuniae]
MAALIEIKGLTVDIPTADGVLRPVRGVDLSVNSGETLAIVGESGCGKSLTSLAIMGLLPRNARVTAERMALAGHSLLGLGERQWRDLRGSRIAMIFQDPMTALDPSYRIGDQLMRVLRRHHPMPGAAAREKVLAMLPRVGISSPETRFGQYPHQLSGGLRQRIMLAMALLCEPDLIIADEPTTALDVTIQAQILSLLVEIQKESGIGLILITHDIGVVAGVAHRVAVMYGGEIVESGLTAEVIGRPQHPYTEGLMRSIPVPGRVRRRERLSSIPGVVPRPVGTLTACGFLTRCPFAETACAAAPIPTRTLDGQHAVRCLRPVGEGGHDPLAWDRLVPAERMA